MIESVMITGAALAAIIALTSLIFQIQHPEPLYLLPIVYCTFTRGWRSGGVSAAIVLGYAIAQLLSHSAAEVSENLPNVVALAATVLLILLMVARLNQRASRALNAERTATGEYRFLFENNPHPMLIYDRETLRFVAANTAALLQYGYQRDEMLDMRVPDLHPAEDLAAVVATIANVPGTYRELGVWRHRTRSGALIDVEITTHDTEFDGRKARLALVLDVTAQVKAEAELRTIRLAVERTSDAIGISDANGQAIYHNPAYRALLGYTPEEVNALGGPAITYADPQTALDVYTTLINGGSWRRDVRLRRADGSVFDVDLRADRIIDEHGQLAGLIGVFTDVTERRRAERVLTALEQRLTQHVENSPLAVIEWDSRLRVQRWSDRAEQLFGWQSDDVIGKRLEDLALTTPDDEEAFMRMMGALLAGGARRNVDICRVYNRNGEVLHCEWYNSALISADGRLVSILSLVHDMTDRAQLQEQFLQAQKMETVGRLAGGIAHDFNNLLTVILSYAELAQEAVDPGDPLHEDLAEVRRAARRAAELTSRLLTFARKQIIQPQPLDLNAQLIEIDKLLRRLIGEDIELVFIPAQQPTRVYADAGQIEQVVVNLVVNARDAMPGGGRLIIETAAVELDAEYANRHLSVDPGSYVMLAVSDTGIGMDSATRARIFEPFFTTKASGKGTGLGLPTCYGIVKQHGGHIHVYSEVGEGSTFRIYLPRHEADTEPEHSVSADHDLPRGNETILLVEDELQVRALALRVLREQGYTVIEAGDGDSALTIAQSYDGELHLLLTDIVMPRMSGRQLAEELQARHPKLQVLYTSGYTENAVVHAGRVDAGVAFIAKPFTPTGLARAVRAALDR
jgi:PAS domain S-box-containing protein